MANNMDDSSFHLLGFGNRPALVLVRYNSSDTHNHVARILKQAQSGIPITQKEAFKFSQREVAYNEGVAEPFFALFTLVTFNVSCTPSTS